MKCRFRGTEQTHEEETCQNWLTGSTTRCHVVKGLTEAVSRIFNKFGAGVASKLHRTIRNELVHPKDKVQFEEVSECIYQILCKNCDKVYVGETGEI